MKKLINSKLLLQVIIASMVATLAMAGIVAAATTVGSNINTAGTLTTSGANTLYGATTVGGALTATTTFAVTGVTTLTGQLNFVNASSTGWIKSSSIKSDTGAISFDDDNLTTTGTVTATTFTGAFTGAVTGTSTRATNLAAGAANQIPYQTAYNTTAFAAAGTSGQLLVANGSAVPTFVTMGTDATISNAGALTIAANAVQGTDIALASEAAGDIMYNDGTDWVRLASSTDANIMIIDANGWPSWAAVSGDATIGATGVLTIGSGAVTAAKLQSAAADLGAANVTVNFGNTNGDFNTNITTDGSITATGGFVGNASTATAATSATSATTATNLAGGAANQIAYQTGAGATSFLTAGTDGQLLVANAAGLPVFVTLGTDATISNAGALTIANGAVTTAKAGTDLSASNLAAILTFADGDLVDISAINGSSAAEGLKLPQATDCSAQTAEGLICWDSDTDALYLGNGAAAVAITNAFGATIDNAEITADTIDFTAIADALTLDVETTIAAAGALNLLIGDNVTLNKTGTGVITATTAGTVTTAAQPTITSVGTLTGLTMGGTLAMGANNITGTGSLGATDAGKLTKGWFVDVESTNMPTVGGTSIASTFAPLANPTFTGQIKKSVQAGITAYAGGEQANAVAITADIAEVTTVGTAADSVKLPTAVAGMQITVINKAAANSMGLWPASGGNINEAGLNLVYNVAAKVKVICTAIDAVNWECQKMAR